MFAQLVASNVDPMLTAVKTKPVTSLSKQVGMMLDSICSHAFERRTLVLHTTGGQTTSSSEALC